MSTAAAAPPVTTPPTPPAPPPTATPAAAPPDPKQAAPAAEPPTPPAPEPEDPFDLRDVGRELLGEEAFPKKKDDKPAAAVPPAPAVPPATTPPAPEPGKDGKVKVRKERPMEEVVETTMRKVMADQPKTVQSPEPKVQEPKPPTAPDPDADYEKSLGEDEKAILETAAFAETKFPDKHKGLRKQWLDYYRKVDSYIEKARKDDPERSFDDEDKQFQEFIEENRPEVDGAAWRRLEHMRVADESAQKAVKESDAKWQKELNATRERQHLLEVRPEIEKTLLQSQKELDEMLVSNAESPVALVEKVIREKGYEEAEKEDPIFVPIVRTIKETTLGNVAEYMALKNGVKAYDETDPNHLWLRDFVREQERYFNENGGEKKVIKLQDGRMQTFASSAEYGKIAKEKPDELDRYWTFSAEQIRRFLIANGQIDAESRVKMVQETISKAGFTRVKANGAPPSGQTPTTPPVETGSPRAATSLAPGPANNEPATVNAPFTVEEFTRMGLPVPK